MQRNSRSTIGLAFLATASAMAPAIAFAHPFDSLQGLAAAAVHPFTGIDHLLAMVAVGLWATHGRNQVEWRLPATFVSGMTVGAILGAFSVPLPLVDAGIVLSVLFLGLAIAAGRDMPLAWAAPLIAGFGLIHGHAHGIELLAGASGLVTGIGFVLSTTALHLIGVAAGLWLAWLPGTSGSGLRRGVGLATVVAGLMLIVA